MSKKKFPNGFDSWQETHYEVVAKIEAEQRKANPKGLVKERHEEGGHCALYSLAEELTDEFEKLNKGRKWDGEFFDEVDEFMKKKLFP